MAAKAGAAHFMRSVALELAAYQINVNAIAPGIFATNIGGGHSKDPAVRKKQDYSGVVVWLEPVGKTAARPVPVRSKILQKDKTFSPHVLVVPTGSTVDREPLRPY